MDNQPLAESNLSFSNLYSFSASCNCEYKLDNFVFWASNVGFHFRFSFASFRFASQTLKGSLIEHKYQIIVLVKLFIESCLCPARTVKLAKRLSSKQDRLFYLHCPRVLATALDSFDLCCDP